MAFEPILWKDRQIERPNTFRMKTNPDGTITLVPVPGTVFQQGTALSAQTLNLMQDKIKQEFNTVATQLAENVKLIISKTEPTIINNNTFWLEDKGDAPFQGIGSGDGISVANAVTSNIEPDSNFWFEPI